MAMNENNSRQKRQNKKVAGLRTAVIAEAAVIGLLAGFIVGQTVNTSARMRRLKAEIASLQESSSEKESGEIITAEETAEKEITTDKETEMTGETEAGAADETEAVTTGETETETAAETEAETTAETTTEAATQAVTPGGSYSISWNDSWAYASCSQVHSSPVTLYYPSSDIRKGIVVAVNAGHGSAAAQQVYNLCHPDGTPKVTSGTTAAGSTTAIGASTGTVLLDGTPEATVTLKLAIMLKDDLLAAGYDVLMIREDADCSLDNIARAVYANNNADCHLALHYDSTDWDKGFYYTSVPSDPTYRAMEPVASTWQKDNALGDALVAGMQASGVKVWETGSMESDLTQTSFSSVASVDVEVGDRASDHSDATLAAIAAGLVAGVNIYFGQ